MDKVIIDWYRFAMRLRQAWIHHEKPHHDPVAASITLNELVKALAPLAAEGQLSAVVEDKIVDARRKWDWATLPDHDLPPDPRVRESMEVVIASCAIPLAKDSEAQKWFNLGLEIVKVDRSASGFTWWDSPTLDSLLKDVGKSLSELFPDSDDQVEQWLNDLGQTMHSEAWVRLEAGLRRLESPSQDDSQPRRRLFHRDQELLSLHKSNVSYSKTTTAWNRKHPNQRMEKEAVRKAIKNGKARGDIGLRSHWVVAVIHTNYRCNCRGSA